MCSHSFSHLSLPLRVSLVQTVSLLGHRSRGKKLECQSNWTPFKLRNKISPRGLIFILCGLILQSAIHNFTQIKINISNYSFWYSWVDCSAETFSYKNLVVTAHTDIAWPAERGVCVLYGTVGLGQGSR